MLSCLQSSDGLEFCSTGELNLNLSWSWRLSYARLIISCQFCWDNGGYLAEFLSFKEETQADDILSKDLHYWIGLTDIRSEGRVTDERERGEEK